MTQPAPRSVWLDPLSPRVFKHVGALLLVAAAAAAFGLVFNAAAGFVFRRGFGVTEVVAAFERLSPLSRLPIVAVGALLAGAVGVLALRYRGGQGVGGVMEAVALGTGRISLRASLWKAVACWLAVVTGSSVGREGPLIQFGGAVAGALGKRFRIAPERVRLLIAAGTAAGFAAAYNTPFAAVLFVLEIVVGVVTPDVVLATVFSAAVATAITRLASGGGPIYGARSFSLLDDRELLLYLLLGLMAGVVGPAFSALLARADRLFDRLRRLQPLTAAIGGVLVGAIAIALPGVTGNGHDMINRVLDGSFGVRALLVLLVAKAFATSVSVGSGTPGGAFTPALFIGATLGGAFGDLVRLALPAHANAPGAYALVGMAAVCAATTHAPLLAAVLVFEFTGDYSIVLPLLVAAGAATAVARRLRPTSMYMEELARRGVTWEMTWQGREVHGRLG